MHYYSHNIADYRKDTGHLSLLEHGIYRQLLDEYYLNEKPIETQQVIRRLSIKTQDELEALENVLSDFFTLSECGKLHYKKRCDAEIKKYKDKGDISRANGSKGGRPKKPKRTQQVNSANPDKTQTKANQEPLTKNHKPITNLKESAWNEWLDYRKLAKLPKLKTDKQAKDLATYSHDVQQQAVNHSIKNEYKGLFPEKFNKPNNTGASNAKFDAGAVIASRAIHGRQN